MARFYVVIDEERGHIVRSGFFGQELFTNLKEAQKVARRKERYVVHDVEPR